MSGTNQGQAPPALRSVEPRVSTALSILFHVLLPEVLAKAGVGVDRALAQQVLDRRGRTLAGGFDTAGLRPLESVVRLPRTTGIG